MDKIQVVNFLLTRKCNLKCHYCRISRNYSKPDEYPSLEYYDKHELPYMRIIRFLRKLKKHNSDIFVIFYGGEPMLYPHLPLIISFCNDNNINYTIITNNSDEVQPKIKELLILTQKISGLTSSIDPILFSPSAKGDVLKKSKKGLENLIKYKRFIDDLVAEITVTPDTIKYLSPLVRELTNNGISSSITFIDIAKSKFYDFSNITNPTLLVQPTNENIEIIKNLYLDKSLDIHMRDQLLLFPDILPSNLNCNIDKDISNITIDADGSIRLCLRIRGIYTPETINIDNIFSSDYKVNRHLKSTFKEDKTQYCKLCNWTCMLHSKLASEGQVSELLHTEKRSA